MFNFRKKESTKRERKNTNKAMNSADFAVFNAVSGSQRSSYGERGEMCSGVMNNNQKLATLQLMRDWKD